MGFTTEQEDFWAGEFGFDYISRNQGHNFTSIKFKFFHKSIWSSRKNQLLY